MQKWTERRSQISHEAEDEFLPIRSAYDRDRARVIHSPSLRRLQAKTQLFNIREHDFLRTRLTHSLEVMQIGAGICKWLECKYNTKGLKYIGTESKFLPQQTSPTPQLCELVQQYVPETALIETICLSHDVGHPPYGHSGEYILNRAMYHHGNFEGNAQSLRLLTYLENHTSGFGLDLTRRTLLGIIKYPTLIDRTQVELTPEQLRYVENYAPGKGVYLEDKEVFDWILEPLSDADRELFTSLTEITIASGQKRKVTRFKSFDCSIMELADDIAYSLHDLEDGIKSKLISQAEWNEFFETQPQEVQQAFAHLQNCGIFEMEIIPTFFNGNQFERKKVFSRCVNFFVTHIEVRQQGLFAEPLLDLVADLPEEIKLIMRTFKRFTQEYLHRDQAVRGKSNKGQRMITTIFEDIMQQPSIMGRKKHSAYMKLTDERARYRFVCDYVACLTNDALDYFYANYVA